MTKKNQTAKAKPKVKEKSFKDELLSKIKKLSKSDKELFNRIYQVTETTGSLVPPVEMQAWIEDYFGSVKEVEHQDFLKITNLITYEGAIFNELRMKRPIVGDRNFSSVIEQIESAKNGPFGHPITGTPEDTFGRVKGKYCITASNIAKYDGLHGLVISNKHDPLLFSRKRVRDYFDVAKKWYQKANKENENAVYPLFTWNCLWKAGASVIHQHCQLAVTEHQAYAKVEELRHLTLNYLENNHSNYFNDDFHIHDQLGLGLERDDIKLAVKLTPIKEKEIMIFSDLFNDNLADIVSDTLNTLKERMGVASFNLVIILPPLLKTVEAWDHMPVLVRIVDRGRLSTQTADVGAMELYAQSIIESNPYTVMQRLRSALA